MITTYESYGYAHPSARADACAMNAEQPPAPVPTAVAVEIAEMPAETAATPAADAGETTTTTFAAAEEEYPIFEPLIARFESDNPSIHVQLVNIEQAAALLARLLLVLPRHRPRIAAKKPGG
jgi:ABC-type glycerol-3-phosphate transport system substrate-binding protein